MEPSVSACELRSHQHLGVPSETRSSKVCPEPDRPVLRMLAITFRDGFEPGTCSVVADTRAASGYRTQDDGHTAFSVRRIPAMIGHVLQSCLVDALAAVVT